MKINSTVYLGIVCLIILLLAPITHAQTISPALEESVPNVKQRLNSKNVQDRISVLQSVVVRKSDDDVVYTQFPFNLTRADYSTIVSKVMEFDLSKIDERQLSETFWRIEELIKKFQMTEFAIPLAGYLSKFRVTNRSEIFLPGILSGILDTLQALKVKDVENEIFPLLESSIEYIKRQALYTLIVIGSQKAVPTLVEELNDEKGYVRFGAMQSLVKINARSSAPEIAKLLNDEDINNRYWALDSLVKLNAKEFIPQIWQFLRTNRGYKEGKNSRELQMAASYALAILVKFGDKNALIAYVNCYENFDERCSETKDFIVKLRATAIIPPLIEVLKKNTEYTNPKEEYKDFRLDIISLLYDLGDRSKISVSILTKILKDRKIALMNTAIWLLGKYQSPESFDDLLAVYRRELPNYDTEFCHDYSRGTCHNWNLFAGDLAVVLAKIGDKKGWRELIDAVSNQPKFLYRSEIIRELNQQIDPELWKKTSRQRITFSGDKPLNEIIDLISKNLGVPVIFNYVENDLLVCRNNIIKSVNGRCTPLFFVYEKAYKLDIINKIPSFISGGTTEEFTVVFDKGKIRILKIQDAVEWWKRNILK